MSARRRVDGSATTGRGGRWLATVASALLVVWVRLTRRITIRGSLPSEGCVAVSFHRSYWDGLLVCMLDERITAVASRAWRTVPGVGAYLDAYGVIWTEEDVVPRASRYVRDGGIVWLAPHGFARTGEHPRPHTGAAQIARDADAPIVCITLTDGVRRHRIVGRRPLAVLIGAPLPTCPDESPAALTDRLDAALRSRGAPCSSSR